MALAKANLTALSAVTTSQTSAAQSVSDAYEATMYVDIVQVGTPTSAATWQPQFSADGAAYYNGPVFSYTLAAGTYDWQVAVPPDATNVKIVFTAQLGGASSTCTAQIGKITGL